MVTAVVLALIGVGAFVGAIVHVASRLLAIAQPLAERHFDLQERALAIQEGKAKNRVPPVVPPDLTRRIMAWGDELAQANERKIILDLYEEFADEPHPWDRVRAHLAPVPSEQVDTTLLM